jgi:chromosome segregation ATPase
MNDYLLQQQQAYMTNQAMVNRLLEQMNEYQMKINYLQQQVYYHRTDLDRLAEQTLQLEDKIRTKEQTIREQEKQIESNNQVLQYDKNMMSSFTKVFESEPYYANQLMTAAMMAYP